jgi:AraC-like DNA-binding protein
MVIFIKPKSRFLSKYIQGFSTFERGCNLNINFAAFPHVGPGLAFFENAILEIKKQHLNIIPTKQIHHNTVVLGKYTSPVFITYNGYVKEISVNFTPLGINYFFNESYDKFAPENFQNLNDRIWIDFGPQLFSTNDIKEQIERFENFLANQFRPLDLEKLQRSIDLFIDKETDYKIAGVAEICGVNEKTMRRKFNQFVGCSPVLFKRIVRFRQSIDVKRVNEKLQNLTQLGQEGLFYDSSHFGREYKLFSGKNPKTFFSRVSFLGNSEYPYIIL